MFKTTVAALALAIATGSAALASDSAQLTDQVRNQIREKLVAQGYDVGKIKTEDGMYEAYAKKDGNRYEIYLDAQLNVVRTEMDD